MGKSARGEVFENLSQELRRGVVPIAVLSQLHAPRYGYSLKQRLNEHGLEIHEGTLYPLLRRLEEQGLLESDWKIENESRPRRYYRLNLTGERVLAELVRAWHQEVGVLNGLLSTEECTSDGTTKLIDRHVHAVGEQLPRDRREDICKELRSALLDDLEARAGEGDPTTAMAAEVLRAVGPPEAMAARYLPDRSLIGPRYYPVYRLILIVILAVVGVGFTLSLIFTLLGNGADPSVSRLVSLAFSFFQAVLGTIGGVTLVFIALERLDARRSAGGESDGWDPLSLAPAEDPDRVQPAELNVGFLWLAFLIVVFNFFPHWVGIVDASGEGRTLLPILAPAFSAHIPWLTALWASNLLLKVILLQEGRWGMSTRWMEFGLGVFELFVIYRILQGGPITTISWLNAGVRFFLWVGLIIGGVEAVVRLVRLLIVWPNRQSGGPESQPA